MKYCLAFIFSFFISCSTVGTYDPAFRKFVKDFEKNCDTKVTLPIKFEKMPDEVLGRCVFMGMPYEWRRIEINPDYWAKATEDQKESTMLHELGHCHLGLPHDSTLVGDHWIFKRPKSLMFPYEFYHYSIFRDEYRKDFFKQCK